MHETLDSLLIESRLRPDDDMPRLVLADWLEENGNEADLARAEFIRIQCQLPRTKGRTRSDLEWRERSLWWKYIETWLGPIYDACTGFSFHRGLTAIELDGERLNEIDLDTLFGCPHWAWIDRVHLSSPSERTFALFLHSPAASRLRSLHVEGGEPLIGEDPTLSECRQLDLLGELVLRHVGLTDRGSALLASCPSLTGLTALDLGDNPLNSAALEVIGRAPALTALTALELGGCPVCDDHTGPGRAALGAFFHGPLAGRLTRLGLAGTGMLTAEMELLASSPMLASLEEVDLSLNHLEDDAIEILAHTPGAAKLKRLFLCENDFLEPGVAALGRSPHLAELESLDLAGNVMTAGVLQTLVEAPQWWGLKRMRLGRVRMAARQRGALRARYGSALELI
jgi:uncharacterized protein (TIGR02996 family)